MAHLSKVYYLVLVGLIFMLTGCELPRDSAATDVPPVEQMPPTLAPLGADTTNPNNNAAVNAATAVPTVVNVQPIVAQPAQVAVVADTPVTQTAQSTNQQAIVVSVTPGVNSNAAEMPAAPEGQTTQPTQEQPIIVDAPNTNNNTAVNPPAAANPPVSDTMGDYAAPVSGNRYIVRPGDTLFGISQRFGVAVEAIVIANNMQDDIVRIGQPLIIPQGDNGYAAPAPQYNNNNQPTYDNNYNGDGYHVVQAGDTLFGIARQYNVTVDSLISLNNLMPPFVIYDGQSLAIPTGDNSFPQPRRQPQYQQPGNDQPQYPMPQPQYQQPSADGTHTVMGGETLFSIASRYGTTAEALALANGLTNPNQIYVGQVLYLPN